MKTKFLFLAMSLMMACVMISCKRNYDHPVSGHTYEICHVDTLEDGVETTYLNRWTFGADGECLCTFTDCDTLATMMLNWKANGEDVWVSKFKIIEVVFGHPDFCFYLNEDGDLVNREKGRRYRLKE